MSRRVRGLAAILALSAVLAVVAAGCGGSESAEEKWAGNVCTEVGDWEDQLKENADNVQEELQSPKLGTLAAIDAQVREAVAATDKLVTDLRALEAPDTEAGAEAERKLNALISQTDGPQGGRRSRDCPEARAARPVAAGPGRQRLEHPRVHPGVRRGDQERLRGRRLLRPVPLTLH
jgi:hypothetical protein